MHPPDLVYFAGQNVIEIHAALSTEADLEKPDQLIVDFDPSDDGFDKVRKIAMPPQAVRQAKITPSRPRRFAS